MTTAESAADAPAVRYRPRRLGHVNLFVGDFRRSMDFYKAVCGLHETARETSSGSGFLSNGNTHHDLGLCDIPRFTTYIKGRGLARLPNHMDRPGLYHFGWEMENEAALVDAYKRALALGLSPRVTDAGTGRSNYMTDPDGYSHQFYADTRADWRSVYIGGETVLHSNPPWDPLAQPASTATNYVVDPPILRRETAPLHPLRVTHGVMLTHRMDDAVAFYTAIAGFDVVHRRADGSSAHLRGSASRHDVVLVAATGDQRPGLHHASFQLDPRDDIDAAADRLTRIGIPVERTQHLAHKRSVTIRDPDGLLVEFHQPGRDDFADIDACAAADLAMVV